MDSENIISSTNENVLNTMQESHTSENNQQPTIEGISISGISEEHNANEAIFQQTVVTAEETSDKPTIAPTTNPLPPSIDESASVNSTDSSDSSDYEIDTAIGDVDEDDHEENIIPKTKNELSVLNLNLASKL